MKMKNIFYTAVIFFSLVMSPITAVAQVASGGNFTLEQSVIASGGGQSSTGGTLSLDGTIGQPVAGFAAAEPFANSIGFWNFSATIFAALGFEADVAARFDGDGLYLSNDIVQIRRFLNGTNTPNPAFNEFQRADSSPIASKGDGFLNSADVVQTRRYLNGTSLRQSAGGPFLLNGGNQSLSNEIEKSETESKSGKENLRQLRVESVSNSSFGNQVTVNILVDAVGDEAEYGFILSYDPMKLSKPVITDGTAGATVRACNTKVVGAINCSVGGFVNNNPMSSDAGIGEIAAVSNQTLISITFTVAEKAQTGATTLTLSNVTASSDAPQLFTPTATGGMVTILAPTAAVVTVAGRVLQISKENQSAN